MSCLVAGVHSRWVSWSVCQVPVHDKTRRDQIGAELWLLKRCRADAAARFEEEEAKAKKGAEDGGQAANANRGGDCGCSGVFYMYL